MQVSSSSSSSLVVVVLVLLVVVPVTEYGRRARRPPGRARVPGTGALWFGYDSLRNLCFNFTPELPGGFSSPHPIDVVPYQL
eukprot:1890364-Rhodomonas_salina.1